MKAKKLPSGNYRVQIYIGLDSKGKKIIKSFTAQTQWETIRKAEEYKRTHGLDCEDLTVYECIAKYIESRRNSHAPSTIRGYEIIKNTRLQMIKDVKCKEPTKNQIQFAAKYLGTTNRIPFLESDFLFLDFIYSYKWFLSLLVFFCYSYSV